MKASVSWLSLPLHVREIFPSASRTSAFHQNLALQFPAYLFQVIFLTSNSDTHNQIGTPVLVTTHNCSTSHCPKLSHIARFTCKVGYKMKIYSGWPYPSWILGLPLQRKKGRNDTMVQLAVSVIPSSLVFGYPITINFTSFSSKSNFSPVS